MEFEFDPNIDYQMEAIDAIVDLFQGQSDTYEQRSFVAEDGVIPNRCQLSGEDILANLQGVQRRNDVPRVAEDLESRDFSVEMETGTGKTYVYLRTIMELFRAYGWQKYIIVVPSVAIREGVIKTLQQTRTHFAKLYDHRYHYFEYDSSSLQDVRSFSRNNHVEIMVITLQAFNKGTDNIMFQFQDELNGNRPVDLIERTRPILILDEPQNMESENSRAAIAELNPLFTFRYSATHRHPYNLVYQLTPFDAYHRNIVKRIDVLSVVKEHDFNTRLIQVDEIAAGGDLKARLTVHKRLKHGIKEGRTTVRLGDSLYRKSNQVDTYEDLTVTNINAIEGFVEFSDGTRVLEGESTDPDIERIQRLQIRETIRQHFEKARDCHDRGIKVLSLFFIDRVSKFTDTDGSIRVAFEEEFDRLKRDERYAELYGDTEPSAVMGSYFSAYKRSDSIESDTEAYELIMRDKERLLSLDEPTEFIFSHSALKEGWDNPNVFNICTLNNTVSRVKKRQEIGRGVRLPVNQEGERIQDENRNILTVVANESYAEYVAQLQSEYEEVTGYDDDVSERVKEAERRTVLTPKEEALESEEFSALWRRIAHQTRYSTTIDSDRLIDDAVAAVDDVVVRKPQIQVDRVSLETADGEFVAQRRAGALETLDGEQPLPDIVTQLCEATNLTRHTVVEILQRTKSTDQFFRNPEEYIRKVETAIESIKSAHLIEEIEYVETGEQVSTDVFEPLTTYDDQTVSVEKSVYPAVMYDSEGEREFALRLDRDDAVRLFVKLPPKFTVPTPVGGYNPDWAIVYDEPTRAGEPGSRLYLIKETKFVDDIANIRPSERMKIECARAHFDAIGVAFSTLDEVDGPLLTPQERATLDRSASTDSP